MEKASLYMDSDELEKEAQEIKMEQKRSKTMNLISDLNIDDLVKNEIEDDERNNSSHLTKIASRPQKGVVVKQFKSKQLEVYQKYRKMKK